MSDEYNLDITQEVSKHFDDILSKISTKDETNILASMSDTLAKFSKDNNESYVKNHLETLENMVQMLSDDQWKMLEYERHYIISVLHYLIEENDIIPDSIPGVGLLDDCVMIDIVEEKLKEKLKKYNAFKSSAQIYAHDDNYSLKDWTETKRLELCSRIRHRRMKYNTNK